jgi:hypothetical protein
MGTRLIYFGLLLIGFGIAGLALSYYETTSTITEEVVRTEDIVRTETYTVYETHTKTVYETEEITRKVTKTETVLSGSVHLWSDPGERPVPQIEKPFQAGLSFEVKSQCQLKINSDKTITKVKILTPSHWKRAQNNPECYVITPFYEWNDVKVLNTGFTLPPGEYILYIYTRDQELTTDYSIDCTSTETVTEKVEKPKEVTETVPVEKTREVTATEEVTEIQEKQIVEKPYEYLLYPSLVSFVGGLGITLYSNFIVPMQVGGGAAPPKPPKPPKGRPPTPEESARLQALYPGLRNRTFTITDGPTPQLIQLETGKVIGNPAAYNCYGWCLCSRDYGWYCLLASLWRAPPDVQLAWFDHFFTTRGWKISKNCKPEKGVRKIALYCRAGTPTHGAKQVEDDWWESKLASQERIVHPGTASLEGLMYGRVHRCYEKDLKTLLKDAQDHLKNIQDRIKAAPEDENLKKTEKETQEQINTFKKAIEKESKKKGV